MQILEQLQSAPNLLFVIFSRDIDLQLAYRTPYQRWEQVGMRGVIISSFTNGVHELVHIRTLTRSRHRAEDEDGRLERAEDGIHEDMDSEDMYDLGEKLRWEHAVAYDGEMVEEEVLKIAFQAAGLDWTKPPVGRRLALPDMVWHILEQWMDQGRPKFAASLDRLMESLRLPPNSESRPMTGS